MNLAFEGHQGFEEKSLADFITTATTGGGVFFQASALSCTENAKSWLFYWEFTHFLVYFCRAVVRKLTKTGLENLLTTEKGTVIAGG